MDFFVSQQNGQFEEKKGWGLKGPNQLLLVCDFGFLLFGVCFFVGVCVCVVVVWCFDVLACFTGPEKMSV